mmetsp:Transcript_17602/g.25319  ORF Transcript_17602/g.25319 Transcript_17602/m.25319 type:complete len:457 (-) Transcript_17602:160-1530(-)
MGESTLVFSRPVAGIRELFFSATRDESNERSKNYDCVESLGDALGRRVVLELMRDREVGITELSPSLDRNDAAMMHIKKHALSQSFFMVNLARLYDQYERWARELPSVTPFYAVKCNPDPNLLFILGKLSCNFDCASLSEMRSIIKLGISSDRIIFANPCKKIHHIRWAREHGIKMMTFDNEPELDKIKTFYPEAELVLRISTDDSTSVCRFSAKFGLAPERAEEVLKYSQNLQLNCVGVSFHVGSGCTDPTMYELAIADARTVFDAARRLGMTQFNLLDIGGGFPGELDSELYLQMASKIRRALCLYFPKDGIGMHVNVIAEPGRFFAAPTHTLLTTIYARRDSSKDPENIQTYYVDDGVYGSFNCVLYDHVIPRAEPLRVVSPRVKGVEHEYGTIVFGPTCDGLDNLTANGSIRLPKLELGDFLLWKDMGAYTCAASGYNFNGMEGPLTFYVFQ